MAQPKVFEFAKEIGIETLALMDKLRKWDIPVKSHMAELDSGTIDSIKAKLAEESAAPASKAKKKTKKKAAAKKKTAKKTASKVTKKTKAKKTASKTVTKKKTTKKKAAESAEPASRTVIRRKASNLPSVKQAEERARKEAEKEAVKEAEEKGIPIEETAAHATVEALAEKQIAKEEAEATEAPARKKQITGKNIVGKMDLSRARSMERPARGGSGGRPSSGSGGRQLRTGFVKVDSAKMPFADAPPAPGTGKVDRTTKRRAPGVAPGAGPKGTTDGTTGQAKDEAPPAFVGTEFRKRETLFQPKKKKLSLDRESKKTQITEAAAHKRVVKVNGTISVADLAQEMSVKAGQLMGVLMKNGVQATMHTMIDHETASLIAPEFKYEIVNVEKTLDNLTDDAAFGDLEAEKVSRSPIVTVMGHVDHGKTTLLDTIRKTKVVSGEAGGITQHIGAYSVQVKKGSKITFIDTPGHEAFTAMRARGANVTDIAIIVIAADDGVMPQTAEAINHAKAAEVPIIIAVNKMDRPGADVDKIKQQVTEYELVPEEWGGNTIFAPVSALNGDGVPELLESIHLVAELAELNANPKRSGTGIVVEAEQKKGRGNVATALVQDGTLEVGQYIVAGRVYGRIRAMIDDRGQKIKKAGPSTPVEILGLNDTPRAGDRFDACKTEAVAKGIATKRLEADDAKVVTPNSGMSLDDLFSKVQKGDVKDLPVVIKTDVSGSGEAIRGMLEKIDNDEVKVKIVHLAVGGISESDVLLASTAKGLIIGFNVRPDSGAINLAKKEGVEIKTYSIVYELLDDIEKAMKGMLAPKFEEKNLGSLEVRETFSTPKVGLIAGCFVTDGKISRNASVRLVRDGRVVYEGKVGSLRRFKDEAKEVATGYECGVGIENYNDIKVGDVIEAYEVVQVDPT